MEEIQDFLQNLGLDFKNGDLYIEALTHRSYLNEKKDPSLAHNERLEFLGDAVLELVITEYLFTKYPNRPEGELTSFRAATVKTDSLAIEAKKLNIGQYLRMSKGEEATGGKDKEYLLANTFEALLGAIYLDLGYEEAKKFVYTNLVPKIDQIVEERLDIDSKTKFQEVAQAIYKTTPTYLVVSEEGPDHDKIFTMKVVIKDKEFGTGKGSSKQRAEENAATEALKEIKEQNLSI
jgi:ribonuclease-3